MKKTFMRLVTGYLVVVMCVMGMVPRVHAGMVSSEITPSPGVERIADLAKIQKAMETKIIKERLKELGFTRKEVQEDSTGLMTNRFIILPWKSMISRLEEAGSRSW